MANARRSLMAMASATEPDSVNAGRRRKNPGFAVIQPTGYMTPGRFRRQVARIGALLRRRPRARQRTLLATLVRGELDD